ncbi:hypothetical protein FZI91_05995 [Mycobacterium sp. CBMA271]|uniref:hypothetical protein n=1 Tax=unclassified Mycobacteroides TaxID=2618759 RepID=UPI0012DCF3D8|nr:MULTISPECIES: hypothetical protein [unclassified Mycobacteroides]MUM15355.1 hypothetical protein [Mycobacteroides sp. CBMA 326]MUM21256.1 hypothetical protein [Mycobacteroides sp. CBMA 271]
MIRALGAASAVVMLILAAALYTHIPTRSESYGPFPVSDVSANESTGRNLDVRVLNVYAAPTVAYTYLRNGTTPESVVENTKGSWVVIDLEYQAVVGTSLLRPYLLMDGNVLSPKAAAGSELNAHPGFRNRKQVIFEAAKLSDSMALRVENYHAVSIGSRVEYHAVLDSQLNIPVQVDDIQHKDYLAVTSPAVSR